MRKVHYGTRWIEYSIEEKQGLKSHYITVERQTGVVLKGKPLKPEMADQLVLKKAKWILDKMDLVRAQKEGGIVTGSRLMYLGRSYYVEVVQDAAVEKITVTFNHSRFQIQVHPSATQADIKRAVEEFYKLKAVEKLTPRVKMLSDRTKLAYKSLSFRKMTRRWGSCTADNRIIINVDAVKLPYTLIDYLVVHELCHTKVKDHSKAYWALLAKYKPDYNQLDERINHVKV